MSTPTSNWLWLGQRAAPPLVLAGPIVRRVDPQGASVWVATKSATDVSVDVFGAGGAGSTPVGSNTQHTIQLGDNLHVALVTVRPTTGSFQPGVVYRYQLTFGTTSFAAALGPATPLSDIAYPDGTAPPLPSFVLPPRDLAAVKFVHASCRKAHGENLDALPVLDDQLMAARTGASDSTFATRRPQQLFLTGDQIYADDLADSWLAMVIDVAGWLMGTRKEPRPALIGPRRDGATADFTWASSGFIWGGTPAAYGPEVPWPAAAGTPWPTGWPTSSWPGVGWRGRLVQATGFTSDPPKEARQMHNPPPDLIVNTDMFKMTAKNHLILLGEFYASFLLAWSPVLWCLPATVGAVPLTPPAPWDADGDSIAKFGARTKAVRRALANIATYMICDDHEVTDDWFMNRLWCERVLGDPGDTVGRRVVRNALIAYAVFEAWGNTPDQFDGTSSSGTNGAQLLSLLDGKAEMDITTPGRGPDVANLVGMPQPLAATEYRLRRPSNALTWRWRWAPPGWPYEVIALDCRTARKYPEAEIGPPQLLDDGIRPPNASGGLVTDEFGIQLGPPRAAGVELTIVIAQTPLFGVRFVEWLQDSDDLHTVFNKDSESWGLSRNGFQLMMSRLAARNPLTLVLSGDVHYSFVAVGDYWATWPWGEQRRLPAPRSARIIQLNSSALKNEIFLTHQVLHRTGAMVLHVGADKNPQAWVCFATGGRVEPHLQPPSPGPDGTVPPPYVPWDAYSPDSMNRPPVIIERGDYYHMFRTPGGGTTLPEGDWTYSINFVSGTGAVAPPLPPPRIDSLSGSVWDRLGLTAGWSAAMRAWHRFANGKTIVGVNNLSTVSFTGPDASGVRHVRQEVAWRPSDLANPYPVPITTYDVALQVQPPPPPGP